jgi:Diguanylate cyclase, GGDEF domain
MRGIAKQSTGSLNPAAAAFEFVVVWMTIAGVALAGWPGEITGEDWLAFAVLLPIIAAVHPVGAERQKHQGSHLSLAPIFAAVLILPPALAALTIAIAFVPEWLRSRPRCYIVVFNVANFVGPALLARAAFDWLHGSSGQNWALAALVAIAVFLAVHYGLLALMLRLARGVRAADTVRLDCVLIDAGLVSLGALTAALWDVNQALVALTLLPLALAYRSLAIPGLIEATRVEPKTGLYNLRHFTAVVSHKNVAEALGRATREYDISARFGDDEFCVLLPETDLEGALVVAHGIRAFVEMAADPRITVSVGVAAQQGVEQTPEDLIGLADRAAYRAKFSGRNSVAVPLEGDAVQEAERVLLDALGGDAA